MGTRFKQGRFQRIIGKTLRCYRFDNSRHNTHMRTSDSCKEILMNLRMLKKAHSLIGIPQGIVSTNEGRVA